MGLRQVEGAHRRPRAGRERLDRKALVVGGRGGTREVQYEVEVFVEVGDRLGVHHQQVEAWVVRQIDDVRGRAGDEVVYRDD
jgi:hypothetical protein